ncbi:MAG: hypothetical protein HYT47_00395 [Candidatus Vogelbacteria bacterium]|nr:hypothetical protein [Candidatus Vogelbacteria bacterium]
MKHRLIFSLLLLPLVVSAAVAKLEFVTPARTVSPGVLSEKITVQTQTADGQSETIGQTADVTFESSSPTGEFLNESGDPVRVTWNSNWANRTFYYRDSSAGNHTLTITVAVRDGGPSWTASQAITVGQTAVEPPPSPDPEPELPPPAPSIVEPPPSPPPAPLAQSLATTTVTTTTNPRPASSTTASLLTIVTPPAATPVPPTPSSAPSSNVDAYAAELTRLGNELARAAGQLQTAQNEKPPPVKSESKVTEPKTPEIDNTNFAAVIEIPKPPSFFERLAAVPRKIWQAIKSFFRRS